MPNKESYQRIKNDPKRFAKCKEEKRLFAKKFRLQHPFIKICNRLLYEKKMKSITPFDLWKLAKKQKLLCPISKEKLTTENMSIDHKIPLKRGGKNDLSNLQLTTKQVNVAKHTLTDLEFIEFCKKIVLVN
jgi:hypothetical protein